MTSHSADVGRWISRHGANSNTVFAAVLVDALARAGVSGAAVGSGSRSTPLVEALVRDDRFEVHAAYDERSAAFFALGRARATGRPALVVTTSGTATANLFPAVVEAAQSGVPLVVVTADRPLRLRGTDANQTIDQQELYGRYVRSFRDLSASAARAALAAAREAVAVVVSRATADPPGPVHLNVRFEKPLEATPVAGTLPPEAVGWREELLGPAGVATGAGTGAAGQARGVVGEGVGPALTEALRTARRPLLVCGPLRGSAGVGVAAVARESGVPLLADPLSGARFLTDTPALPHYDLWIEPWSESASRPPDLVVRVGRAPTSAPLNRFLAALPETSRQILLTEESGWTDHLSRADVTHARAARWLEDPGAANQLAAAADCDPAWTASLSGAVEVASVCVRAALDRREFEPAAVLAALSPAPPGAVAFLGNSNVIRDVDAYAPGGQPLRAIGFRGASGIDGNLAGALGATIAAGGPGVAIVGDMTFLHDVNALQMARGVKVALAMVVIHNDGGGIFHRLPVRHFDPPFEQHIVMPHGIDPADVAEAFGIPTRRLDGHSRVAGAVAHALEDARVTVIRVRTGREAGAEARRRLAREVHAAFGSGL